MASMLPSQCIILFAAAASSLEVEEVKYDGAVSGGGGLQADESDCLRWIKSEAEVNAQHTECASLL